MLKIAIKIGFDIDDLKKRDYGEGNKIYFKYKIFPLHTENISLNENGSLIKPVEIEEKLVRDYKANTTLIKFYYNDNIETLIYAIKYYNSFQRIQRY